MDPAVSETHDAVEHTAVHEATGGVSPLLAEEREEGEQDRQQGRESGAEQSTMSVEAREHAGVEIAATARSREEEAEAGEEEQQEGEEEDSNEALFRRRYQVAQELVNTEQTYVQNLLCMIDVYQNPLTDALAPPPRANGGKAAPKYKGPILTPKEIGSIFCNAEQIYFLNSKFLAALRGDFEKVEKGRGEAIHIGKTFVQFSHFFKMYSIFCNAHKQAQTLIGEYASQNARFAEFLKTARQDPRTGGFDIQSFLIMPIQRIPRLKMLLEEMLKCTPQSHGDFEDLTKGLEILSSVATIINLAIHERQNRIKVWQVAEMMTRVPFNLLEPHRLILHEGFLSKICRKGQVRRWYFFLFSDCLIYARKVANNWYKFHQRVTVLRFTSLSPADVVQQHIKNLSSVDTLDDVFIQITGREKSFMAYADSTEEKQEWCMKLATALKAQRKVARGRHDSIISLITPSPGSKKGSFSSAGSNSNSQIGAATQDDLSGSDDNEDEESGDVMLGGGRGRLPVSDKDDGTDYVAPMWENDQNQAQCPLCGRRFTFLWRRHHCRYCGTVVCDSCSKHRFWLPHISATDAQRTCDNCAPKVDPTIKITKTFSKSNADGPIQRRIKRSTSLFKRTVLVDDILGCPGVTFEVKFNLRRPLGIVFDTVFVNETHDELCAVVRRLDERTDSNSTKGACCQAAELGVKPQDIILQVDSLDVRSNPTQYIGRKLQENLAAAHKEGTNPEMKMKFWRGLQPKSQPSPLEQFGAFLGVSPRRGSSIGGNSNLAAVQESVNESVEEGSDGGDDNDGDNSHHVDESGDKIQSRSTTQTFDASKNHEENETDTVDEEGPPPPPRRMSICRTPRQQNDRTTSASSAKHAPPIPPVPDTVRLTPQQKQARSPSATKRVAAKLQERLAARLSEMEVNSDTTHDDSVPSQIDASKSEIEATGDSLSNTDDLTTDEERMAPSSSHAAVLPPPKIRKKGSVSGQAPKMTFEIVDAVFQEGPFGFGIGASGNRVFVRRLAPEGQAEKLGVRLGDVLTVIGSELVSGFTPKQTLSVLKGAQRPLSIAFRRKSASADKALPSSIEVEHQDGNRSSDSVSPPPRPRRMSKTPKKRPPVPPLPKTPITTQPNAATLRHDDEEVVISRDNEE